MAWDGQVESAEASPVLEQETNMTQQLIRRISAQKVPTV